MPNGNHYQGAKFRTILQCSRWEEDPRLAELQYWAGIFRDKGLAPDYPGGSYGNLSFRLRPAQLPFMITASHTTLERDLPASSLVKVSKVNLQEELVYACGWREPSSETLVHYCIYQARPEINAVFHGHCPLILAKARELHLPETSAEAVYGTHELAEAVLRTIDQHNFLIMKNHGFLSLGQTMQEAGNSVLTVLTRSEKCL